MPSKRVLITGSSSGFGYELAKLYKEMGYDVFGLSRSKSDLDIRNIVRDFSDLSDMREMIIPPLEYDYVILNAGILGKIDFIGNLTTRDYEKAFNVNFHSNKIILDQILKGKVKNVIGISSGAAHKTYLGWSLYCTTKAAFKQLISGYADEFSDTNFISLAPGIMKTKMQDYIYSIDEEKFPSVKKFKALYDGEMDTPQDLAKKFVDNIDDILSNNVSGSFFDMRDI